TSPELEVVNVERIITDDIKDITPGTRQAVERTDKKPDLEVKKDPANMTDEELDQEIEDLSDDELLELAESAGITEEKLEAMTEEEVEKKIKKEKKNKAKKP
ncbi:unnamed protein product, partial [marine sediment metagenome]